MSPPGYAPDFRGHLEAEEREGKADEGKGKGGKERDRKYGRYHPLKYISGYGLNIKYRK